MAANIDRITSVQIALRSRGIQVQSFNDGMLLDEHSNENRFGWIAGPDELLTGWGLDTDSPLYRGALAWFSQIPHPRRLGIGRRGSEELIDTALAACRKADSGWYGFAPVAHNPADVLRAAAWGEGNERLHFNTLSDPDIAGVGGVGSELASELRQNQYFRTATYFNPDPDTYTEVAAMARGFSVLPGGENWHMNELAGVAALDIEESDSARILAKNVNTFEYFSAGIAATQGGKTAAGEFIDVIRFRDWQAEDIRTRCFKNQLNRRIPYTDPGINLFKVWVSESLALGREREGIAPEMPDPNRPNVIIPSFLVTVPARANISSNQVASRVLTDVNFVARLAGSINFVEIRGELTYDNIG